MVYHNTEFNRPTPGVFIMSRIPLSVLIVMLFCKQAAAEVSVAVTIRPLQFIAGAIVGDQGSVVSIVDRQDSPHSYSISPSDRVNLEGADLSLRIGPGFEVFLSELMEPGVTGGSVLTVLTLPGLTLHRLGNGQTDPHLWLDPDNALVIGRALAVRLADLDPANQAHYRRNLEHFQQQIDALTRQLTQRFSAPAPAAFLVYHDAYQYFEKRFDLSHGLSLLADPEVQPSMREILSTRSAIASLAPRCLFMEIDSDPALVDTMLGGRRLNTVVVDLLGYGIDTGTDGYIELIEAVAEDFATCLYDEAGLH